LYLGHILNKSAKFHHSTEAEKEIGCFIAIVLDINRKSSTRDGINLNNLRLKFGLDCYIANSISQQARVLPAAKTPRQDLQKKMCSAECVWQSAGRLIIHKAVSAIGLVMQ